MEDKDKTAAAEKENVAAETATPPDGKSEENGQAQNTAKPYDGGAISETAEKTENAQKTENPPKPERKPRFSGAYWFCDKSAEELQKQSFVRTMLTVIATLLQLVVLLLPQSGIGYITENLPSYAFVYMCSVFVMLFAAVFVIIMNFRRYKLRRRIPKEYAPRRGFKYRSFFGAEALVAVTAVLLIMEISFVCLSYDGFGLLGVFLCALSTAAAVWARTVTVLVLKDAVYVPAIGEEAEAAPDAASAESSDAENGQKR